MESAQVLKPSVLRGRSGGHVWETSGRRMGAAGSGSCAAPRCGGGHDGELAEGTVRPGARAPPRNSNEAAGSPHCSPLCKRQGRSPGSTPDARTRTRPRLCRGAETYTSTRVHTSSTLNCMYTPRTPTDTHAHAPHTAPHPPGAHVNPCSPTPGSATHLNAQRTQTLRGTQRAHACPAHAHKHLHVTHTLS